MTPCLLLQAAAVVTGRNLMLVAFLFPDVGCSYRGKFVLKVIRILTYDLTVFLLYYTFIKEMKIK